MIQLHSIEIKEFSKYSLNITLLFIDYRNRFKNAAELLQLIKEVGRKLELIDFKDDQNNSNVSNVDLIGVETTKNDNENGNKHTSIFLMLSYLYYTCRFSKIFINTSILFYPKR